MMMFAALRKEDLEELMKAERVAKEAIDDPKVFAERMRNDSTFANLYQNDRRAFELHAK